MLLRLDRTKMAMSGNVFCYDVEVPVSEVDRSKHSYFICHSDGTECVMLCDATRPASLDAMPRGWERYSTFQKHSKACDQWAWAILQKHFPELSDKERTHFIDLPGFTGGHATLTVEV